MKKTMMILTLIAAASPAFAVEFQLDGMRMNDVKNIQAQLVTGAENITRIAVPGVTRSAGSSMILAAAVSKLKMSAETLKTISIAISANTSAPAEYSTGVKDVSELVREAAYAVESDLRDGNAPGALNEIRRIDNAVIQLRKLADSVKNDPAYEALNAPALTRIAGELEINSICIRSNAFGK